jgi:hypothetical protein
LDILSKFIQIKQRSTNTNNLYQALTAELPLNRAKKQAQKSTSIRKGGRNDPGACLENYVSPNDDGEENEDY